MVQIIPDGSNTNDSITIGFGAWRGVGAHALDGNDTLSAENGSFTVAGGGNLLIAGDEGTGSMHLGDGNDTVHFDEGDMTLVAGGGRDSISFNEGVFSIRLGGGQDTVSANEGAGTIRAGGGSDSVRLHEGRYSVHLGSGSDTVETFAGTATIVAGKGQDSIRADEGHFSIKVGSGVDTVAVSDGSATIVTGNGPDKIHADDGHFSVHAGLGRDTIGVSFAHASVTANGGHDSIQVLRATGSVHATGAHDTISVGGAVTLSAGHRDLITFQDLSGSFSGPNAHAVKSVVVNATGSDTFQYQYNDDPADTGAADAKGIGAVTINHFHKATDVLKFHDRGGGDLSQGQVNAHATVSDHVGGHSITIVVDTAGGVAAGTIVLKGIGTLHHHLASINDLVTHGYNLEFG